MNIHNQIILDASALITLTSQEKGCDEVYSVIAHSVYTNSTIDSIIH